MINFVVLTDTPARLRNFLVSRGIIKEATVTLPGDDVPQTIYSGVRSGMEWVEVPNPIVTDPGSGTVGEPGYVPPTYDDRKAYLVKFSDESATNEVDGDTGGNPYDWSKFGKWVKANSTVVTAPPNYTINGEPVGDAYKINGEQVWLVRNEPDRFGAWQ
jgi:hypothetical protein